MKTSESLERILASENQTVSSYCDQIVNKKGRALELICQHILDLLLPACAEFDAQAQTMGSNDQDRAIDYLRTSLKRLEQTGDDAGLMISAILDLAWTRLPGKYSRSEKIELAVITRVNSSFLFADSNKLLNMNLTGPFGGQAHREFTRAPGLAAMIVATQEG